MTEGLATFFGALGKITHVAAEAQRRLDRELATNFNVTTLFQPHEIRLSDIIACLLDPAEVHGQGDRFLNLFIEMFSIPCTVPISRGCRVGRERGRLDVLVEINSSKPFAIGIENKPWADHQPDQVLRYCDYLERYFPDQWWFGYFSGTGAPPPNHSLREDKRRVFEEKGKFRTIPFVRSNRAFEYSIENWVTRCSEVCIAERVRWFLRDISSYFESTFTNAEDELQ
jgi:hypothetical protein